MMFQIKDDLLDCYGDEKAKLGKKVGSDLENNKSTYVSLLGKHGDKYSLLIIDAAVDELTQIDEQFNTKHLL